MSKETCEYVKRDVCIWKMTYVRGHSNSYERVCSNFSGHADLNFSGYVDLNFSGCVDSNFSVYINLMISEYMSKETCADCMHAKETYISRILAGMSTRILVYAST